MFDEEGLVEGRTDTFTSGGGRDRKVDPPLSLLEALLQAHPEITVGRGYLGDVGITQALPNGDARNIQIMVQKDRNAPDNLYPNVVVSGLYDPRQIGREQWERQHIYGFRTFVIVHSEPDEQVRADIKYSKKETLPEDLRPYAIPISAIELVTAARTGLEILEAYIDAPGEEKRRVEKSYSGQFGHPQVEDGIKSNIDASIAKASTVMAGMLNEAGISYTHAGTKVFFALNALKKVTQEMLPKEPPKFDPPTPPK